MNGSRVGPVARFAGGLRVPQTQIHASAERSWRFFFSHEPDIRGRHILLVEGWCTGVTSEFPMSDLRAQRRGFGKTGEAARLVIGGSDVYAAGRLSGARHLVWLGMAWVR